MVLASRLKESLEERMIKYTVRADFDSTPISGNASASGDKDYDKKVEDQIKKRFNAGNPWAWASVTVRAIVTIDGRVYTGEDHLGCVTAYNEQDFIQNGGYYKDMCEAAKQALLADLNARVESAEAIRAYLNSSEDCEF
jgi:hypothetical protein